MKKTKLLLLGLLVSAYFSSCSKDENFDVINLQVNSDTNFVDNREVIAIATMFQFPIDNTKISTRSISTYLEVDNITPIGNEEKPSYYIVNYKNNSGFSIIAGDKRANAVLAFSTEGNFNLDLKNMPTGLIEWLDNTDAYISEIRITNQRINQIEDQQIPQEIDPCNDEVIRVGPLLKTEWGQYNGYNNRVPKTGCDKAWYNPEGKAPAGCVAVATAQIMGYHKYPKSFNWSIMPDTYGNDETAILMRDLGVYLKIDYKCDGSSAYVSDIPKTLKLLGYNSAKHKSYGTSDYNLVVNQIDTKLPVVLGGATNSVWGTIGIYPNGHAWVCDGYSRHKSCNPNGGFSSALFFHMNWGWDNGLYNGWFDHGNWAPERNNNGYNNRTEIVYDIKP